MAMQALEAGSCLRSPARFCCLCLLSKARDGWLFAKVPNPCAHPGRIQGGSDRQIQESDFLCMNAEPTENITFCCALAAGGVNAN